MKANLLPQSIRIDGIQGVAVLSDISPGEARHSSEKSVDELAGRGIAIEMIIATETAVRTEKDIEDDVTILCIHLAWIKSFRNSWQRTSRSGFEPLR